MKHLRITNLENPTMLFEGTALKRKRELLGEAALLDSAALDKDVKTAAALAQSLKEFSEEIEREAEATAKRMQTAARTTTNAALDFVAKMLEESQRLSSLKSPKKTAHLFKKQPTKEPDV